MTKTYAYDNRGRLVRVTHDGAESEAYTYDANGNRLTGRAGADLRAGTYDARGRQLTYGAMPFDYSANGVCRRAG